MLYKALIHCTVVKSSCTTRSFTRQGATVLKVGGIYVSVRVSRRLKEELALVIDKRLRDISNKMLFKTVVPL